jgi:hypothetical protein
MDNKSNKVLDQYSENVKLTLHQCDGIHLKWVEIPEVELCHHARPQVFDEEAQ